MRLREQKDGRPLPHQDRRPRLTVRYPQQIQATESKTLQAKGAKFRAATKNWQNPSCKLWHPPVFLNYKSETGCKGGSMLDHQLLPFLLHAVGIERVRGDLRHHWLLTLLARIDRAALWLPQERASKSGVASSLATCGVPRHKAH